MGAERSREARVNDRFDFDELAKELAGGLSRREALRRLAIGLAGVLLAPLGARRALAQGNSACARFCTDTFPPGDARGRCASDAAHGQGLCYGCGPAAPAGHPDLCGLPGGPRGCCSAALPHCCSGTTCVNKQTDPSHCGACGNICPARPHATPTCTGGMCGYTCLAGFGDCNASIADGCETDLTADVGNCGACGNACTGGRICTGGVCGCPPGQVLCGGACVNSQADAGNCGSCGHVCDPSGGETCCGGACVTCHYNACCGSQGFACCLAHLGETCCDGVCCPTGQHCENGVCQPGCQTDANCISSRPEVCIQGICCLPPGSPYYGGACNGACYTCPYDACCGTNGFGCCLAHLGETCCDGACCPAGQHCESGVCKPGCVSDANCISSRPEVCTQGICCLPAEFYGGVACNGACFTCHYDACCGSQGFGCCLPQLGETCCDGACCAAGEHCENGVCQPGCLTDANCIASRPEVCRSGVCVSG